MLHRNVCYFPRMYVQKRAPFPSIYIAAFPRGMPRLYIRKVGRARRFDLRITPATTGAQTESGSWIAHTFSAFVGRGRWGDVFDRSRFLRGTSLAFETVAKRRILFKFCRRIVDIRNIMEQLHIATSVNFTFVLRLREENLGSIANIYNTNERKKVDVINRWNEKCVSLARNACGRQFVLV